MSVLSLPHNCILLVISFLPITDICSVRRTCKPLDTQILEDSGLWKALVLRDFRSFFGHAEDSKKQNPESMHGGSSYFLKYQEYHTLPQCNGLVAKLEVHREDAPSPSSFQDAVTNLERCTSVKIKRTICKLTFTLTLVNTTASPLVASLGCTGESFDNGALFHMKYLLHNDEPLPEKDGSYIGNRIRFCRSRSVNATIAAKASQTVGTEAFIVESEGACCDDDPGEEIKHCVLFYSGRPMRFLLHYPQEDAYFCVQLALMGGMLPTKYVNIGTACTSI